MSKSPDAFRTISEVADWLGTPTHVLRFWESRFSQVKPVKRAGGRRYYRPTDMALLGGIKKLLHEDGMTIRGVQKLLREEGVKHVAALSQVIDDIPAEPEQPVTDETVEGVAQPVPDAPDQPTVGETQPDESAAASAAPNEPEVTEPIAPAEAEPAVDAVAAGVGADEATGAELSDMPMFKATQDENKAPPSSDETTVTAAEENTAYADAAVTSPEENVTVTEVPVGHETPPSATESEQAETRAQDPPADPTPEPAKLPNFLENWQEPPQPPDGPTPGETVLSAISTGQKAAPGDLAPIVEQLNALRARMSSDRA